MDEQIAQLEAAMVAAHRAGDAQSAAKLAAEITRLRSAPPETRAMLEALRTTPRDQWQARMQGAGFEPEMIQQVMSAGGAADFSNVESGSSSRPVEPTGRDVSPGVESIGPGRTWGDPRREGREAAARMRPIDAAAIPLPSEETTPPVTKTSGVMELLGRVMGTAGRWKSPFYRLWRRGAGCACSQSS